MSQPIISAFYDAFSQHDAKAMNDLYHEDILFNDPVFKELDHRQVTGMWHMLIARSKGELDITFHSVISDAHEAHCIWEANYFFSKTKRPVHNIIHSQMEMKDGKIIRHTDTFDLWRWCRMALGLPGALLGWTPMLQQKVRKTAAQSLEDFLQET